MAAYIVLGALGLVWIIAYQESTYSVRRIADREHNITGPPTVEHQDHYGHSTGALSDFRDDDYAELVSKQIGQFGIVEELRYENDGAVTRTFELEGLR